MTTQCPYCAMRAREEREFLARLRQIAEGKPEGDYLRGEEFANG